MKKILTNRFMALCCSFVMVLQLCVIPAGAEDIAGTYVEDSTLYIDLSSNNIEYPIRTLLAFYSNNAADTVPSNPMDVVIFEQSLTQIESSYDFTPIAEPKDYMIVLYEGRNGQQVKDVITLPHVTHWFNDWSKDETGHWKECANASCDYSTQPEPHGSLEGDLTDCTANTHCGICGYVVGASNQAHLYTDCLDADCNRDGCLNTRTAAAVEITFNVNGGNTISQTTVTTDADGKLANDLPTPTRNGWSFNGWYTAATGGTKINKATTVFYDDATIYAQWTSVYAGAFVEDSTLYIDLSSNNIEYPIRTLLAFYTNNAADTVPSNPMDVVIFEQSLTQIESSYDFTPIAEPKDYMIVLYEGRNGQQVKDVITLPHVTHWFNDWSKDETGHWKECANLSCDYSTALEEHSGSVGNANDCTVGEICEHCEYILSVAHPSHLYTDSLDADCNREGCLNTRAASAVEITFNVNGGSALTENTVTTGADGKITSDLPQPTRNGWSFNGWYTAASGGTKIAKNSTVFYENATVYAQWKSVYQTSGGSSSSGGGGGAVVAVTYKLHFETNGGTGVNDLSRQKGIEINVNGFVPKKEGFKFVGWYMDADFETSVEKITLTNDMTVYAKWEVIEDEPVTEPEPSEKTFTDVSETDWFSSSVAFVLEKGIMNGVSETEFAPHNTTTRAMLVTMLYRLEGEPETLSQKEFSDVLKDSYYEKAVIWAKEKGIVNGYENGSFGTDDEVTREQLASILYRYAEHKGYDANYEDTNILSFNDAFDISEYAYPALAWACKNGIINGDGNNLMPKASAERCQVAAIFARFCELNK